MHAGVIAKIVTAPSSPVPGERVERTFFEFGSKHIELCHSYISACFGSPLPTEWRLFGRIGLTQGNTKDLPDDVGRSTGDEHDEYLPSCSPDQRAFGKFADDGTDDAGSHHTEHERRDGRSCA